MPDLHAGGRGRGSGSRPGTSGVEVVGVLRQVDDLPLADPVLGRDDELVLPRSVAEVGDPLPVRGPGGEAVRLGGRCWREVPRSRRVRPARSGSGPGVRRRPAGRWGRSVPDSGAGGALGLDPAGAGRQSWSPRAWITSGSALVRGRIEPVEPAGLLVHQHPSARAQVLHVEVGVEGPLAEVARRGIEGPDVEHPVALREEVHHPVHPDRAQLPLPSHGGLTSSWSSRETIQTGWAWPPR
jgi:hypothetical protein